MQFRSMEPMKEGFPETDVADEVHHLDLHNDGDLREIAYDCLEKALRVSWIMKEPAWKRPTHPETADRKTIASATLIFSGVRELRVEGSLVTSQSEGGLDFLEYHREGAGVGEVRIVMLNGSTVVVRGSGCELRKTIG